VWVGVVVMTVCKADSAVYVRGIPPQWRSRLGRISENTPGYEEFRVSVLDQPQLWRHNSTYTIVIREERMTVSGQDPKVEALRAERSLNPRPEAVTDETFMSSGFMDPQDLVQVKYEMVRRVRVDGKPVSGTAAAFGFSRPTFYEAAAALDTSGLAGLVPARPGPRRAHKLTEVVVVFAQGLLDDDPSLRSVDLVEKIGERFGVSVHPRSVERALTRAAETKKGGSG